MPPSSDNGKQSLVAVSQSEAMLSGGRDSTGCSLHTSTHAQPSAPSRTHKQKCERTSTLFTFTKDTLVSLHIQTHSPAHVVTHIHIQGVGRHTRFTHCSRHSDKFAHKGTWAEIHPEYKLGSYTHVHTGESRHTHSHTHTQVLKAHVPSGM